MPSKDSKTNFALLREKILGKSGKEYWRSVEEFVDSPEFEEFVKHEYPAARRRMGQRLSRRNFIKVMGASLALAGLSGCVIQPSEKIVPYVTQPEEIIPGKPFLRDGDDARRRRDRTAGQIERRTPDENRRQSRIIREVSARPTCARRRALLNMYDPDRSQEILFRGRAETWQNFMTELLRAKIDENRADGGAGIRFLTETVTSPTLIAQMAQIQRELPNARWYQYEPVNKDNATAARKWLSARRQHGLQIRSRRPRFVARQGHLLGFQRSLHEGLRQAHVYSEEKKEINRLYAIETTMTA
jgi:MoCo/4Fe-4S cofactor protein with predicted Tat translocation signal